MTDLTDDQVQALLDGATPGPWRADGEPWNRIVWSSADNRVCFMAHSSGLNDARDIATSNLIAAAPDLARALLDARAELAQARADAKAAQALVVERFRHDLQFMVDSIAEDKAYVADKYPALFKTIQARLAEMGTFGGVQVFGEIARDLLVLADADGLAAVEALRVEARENAMQALASMGQAQEAYEAQLEAEAELAAAQQREARLRAALEYYADTFCEGFCKDLPQAGTYQPEMDLDCSGCKARAALAQTIDDPGDGWTWNERLGWIGPDGKPADPRRRG